MHDTDRFSRPQVTFADRTPTTAPTWSSTAVPVLPALRTAGTTLGKRLARGTVPPLPALRRRPPTILVQERPDAPPLPIRAVSVRRWGHVEKVDLAGLPLHAGTGPGRRPSQSADPTPLVAALAIAIAALLAILATSRSGDGAARSTAGAAARSDAPAATSRSIAARGVQLPQPVITALPEPEIEPEIEIEVLPRAPTIPAGRARPAPPALAMSTPSRSTADLDGTLAIGAKPPCRIIVDGRDTGLMTPQRALRLPAGRHEIVLINQEYGVEDRSIVVIGAGSATRLVRDLSAHLGS